MIEDMFLTEFLSNFLSSDMQLDHQKMLLVINNSISIIEHLQELEGGKIVVVQLLDIPFPVI